MKYEEIMELGKRRDENREKLEKVEQNYKETRKLAEELIGFCIGKAFSFDMLGEVKDPDMVKLMTNTMEFINKGTKLLDDLLEIELDTNKQVNGLLYTIEMHDDKILENLKDVKDTLKKDESTK